MNAPFAPINQIFEPAQLLMKNFLYVCFAGSMLLTACSNNENKSTTIIETSKTDSTIVTRTDTTSAGASAAFDINTIPVTSKEIGKFPYLNAPEGYHYNDVIKSDFENLHFAIKGRLTGIEGKSYKTNIYKNRDSDTPFSPELVDRAYNKAITDLGGVQVSDKILPGEIERIGKKVLEQGNHAYSIIGDNDYTLSHVRTYVLRTAAAEIWIELSLYEGGGYINILQKEAANVPKVSIIKADEIKSELDKSGKAVLHINFDVDKASLLADGKDAVNQILPVLKNNPDLKLSIEGHTDNSGAADKNKTLSIARANTVLQSLVQSGISASRLKATGFGASKPLTDNDTDAGKAQNRRVELVKI
ncbi:OmpA family protein [Pedobacter duraquae]|uniref:OmpA family protein n=2 Tax=Pedobacter duraquae TaxID=425511 RepID=A0A4R6IMQ1_9SPHI|nr:OmpA family protein [Pedobacter duraquae]